MQRNITAYIVVLYCFITSLHAQVHIISGYVRDAKTKEVLIGGNVYGVESKKGCFTNSYGFYSLALSKGKGIVHYSFLGYEDATVEIDLHRDTVIHVYLYPMSEELAEVVVLSNTKLKDMRMGIIDISAAKIKNTPALLGETDLLKSLQFMPGVQNTTEGKSDLSVRGGSPDQNLILLDDVPIYNATHVFGFLSVFNTDALKKVTLYKSNFPARFGGRLSSVVDITTKDGNKEKFSGSATIGLPTLKFGVEIPAIKDRTSITFSARRTYLDLFMGMFIDDHADNSANFSFHDLNAKIHHRINDKTFVYLSAYNGNDKLNQKTVGIENRETNHETSAQKWNWGNTIVSGKLSRVISSGLFFKTALTYNKYHYKINTDDEYVNRDDSTGIQKASRSFLFSSGIKDYSLSGDFEYFPTSNHNVKFGTTFIFHDFNPEVISLKSMSDTTIASDNAPKHTLSEEFALYIEDEWDISEKLRMNVGARFSLFRVDKKTYASVDPRLSLRFLLSDKISLQSGYTHMQQYVHLLSSNSVILQTDLWVPVTGKIKPMQSKQYAFGVLYEPSKSVFLSLEAYYKDMKNVMEYSDGISYTGVSAGWENKVEAGTGRAYGMEISAEKKNGRITGTASYTLSKSERKFDEINFGEWFPSKYDRRHAINLSLNYKLNDKFDLTTTWTYHSGSLITLPLMTYVSPDVPDTRGNIENLMELDHRNNYQMTNYHRMDLGVNYTFRKRADRYCMLNLSIYNVYNRMNPYKLIVESDMHKSPTNESIYTHKLKQITLFPLIPSLSFTYHF